eukprot:1140306-Pelagomonas_calceolata.AAC.2
MRIGRVVSSAPRRPDSPSPKYTFPRRFPDKQRLTSSHPDAILSVTLGNEKNAKDAFPVSVEK